MQNDFIEPTGKLPIVGAKKIVGNCKKIMQTALQHDILILGSVDRHFRGDPELEIFPEHCMDGTIGQQIIPELQVKNTVYVPNKINEMGAHELLPYGRLIDIAKEAEESGKIIFEKQTTDVFTNPHVFFILEKLNVTKVFLYGVATDYCVKEAIYGLTQRGVEVTGVIDAVQGIDLIKSIEVESYGRWAITELVIDCLK